MFKLLHDFGGLGPQPARYLILAPPCLDLGAGASSRLRSRDGVMPITSYQTKPPLNWIASLSTPTSLLKACETTSSPRGMLDTN